MKKLNKKQIRNLVITVLLTIAMIITIIQSDQEFIAFHIAAISVLDIAVMMSIFKQR